MWNIWGRIWGFASSSAPEFLTDGSAVKLVDSAGNTLVA